MKKETWITMGICCVFLLTAGFFYLHRDGGYSGAAQSGVLQSDSASGNSSQDAGKWEAVQPEGSDSSQVSGEDSSQADTSNGECTIYICGAVKKPGVYHFSSDSRVYDAVDAAGGFTKKAATEAVNLARPLVDGEQIRIPKRSEAKGSAGSGTELADGSTAGGGLADGGGTADSSRVNINEAGREELMSIPGIGEAKAQLILDYRSENGRFSSTEDIMKISGIKEGIYNNIKDYITV